MKKTKILIAGIGGVGGYFGGLLAKHYHENESVDVSFVARGEHLEAILENGLKVINGDSSFIAKPAVATEQPADIGIVDYIIICTKTYDLEAMVEALKPCINADTIILPLLNGVNSRERIQKILPMNTVLDGCVYIVARLKQAGVVENAGNIQTLYFGLENDENPRLEYLEKLMQEAKLKAIYSKEISKIIWEKYIFISPTATATSYYNKSIGELLYNLEMISTIKALTAEVLLLAEAKQIAVSEDSIEKVMHRLKSMPFEATSSMHSDFRANKPKTELQALTAYVLDEGQKYHIEMPTYSRMFESLVSRREA